MEDLKVDTHYKQGFEIGYWLTKGNSPHVKDIMHNNANESPYHKGLKAGNKEARKEQTRANLRNDQSNSQEKGIELD